MVKRRIAREIALLARVAVCALPALLECAAAQGVGSLPKFEPDPYWPKPLPKHWVLGQVSGVHVDSHDHIWVIQRPRTVDEYDKYEVDGKADCCVPAPPVLEFDIAGSLVQAWGGPGPGYEWPDTEHGIFVDYKDNVWVTGSGAKDAQILKFTKTGKFLLQIGHHGKSKGNNDTENLGRPAAVTVYPATNEVFVADGYGNRRVIVFDGDTGAYKRHWGAYGRTPDDSASPPRQGGAGSPQFNLVHAVAISNDGLLYVCDRLNGRIQVFRLDGSFVKEGYVERKTTAEGGTAFGVGFSPDRQQRFMYVADASDRKVHIVNRETLGVVDFFGGIGGNGVGEFAHNHSIAADSKGNVYVGESDVGRRVLRWNYKGMSRQ